MFVNLTLMNGGASPKSHPKGSTPGRFGSYTAGKTGGQEGCNTNLSTLFTPGAEKVKRGHYSCFLKLYKHQQILVAGYKI